METSEAAYNNRSKEQMEVFILNNKGKKDREKILRRLQPLFNLSPFFVLCMLLNMLILVRNVERFWQLRVVAPIFILLLSALGLGITIGFCAGFTTKTVNVDNFSNFSSKKNKKIKR